jgi:uncharacterized membrane protein
MEARVRYEVSVHIDGPAERVWTVLSDVERWPTWTASMSEVRRLDSEPFGVGSRARVKQPRFPAVVWRVTEFEPGRSFAWQAESPGGRTLADHRVSEAPAGGVDVTLLIEQSGPLAVFFGFLNARLIRRYVDLEAASLKRRCEAG